VFADALLTRGTLCFGGTALRSLYDASSYYAVSHNMSHVRRESLGRRSHEFQGILCALGGVTLEHMREVHKASTRLEYEL
jgi:hypothetical protein